MFLELMVLPSALFYVYRSPKRFQRISATTKKRGKRKPPRRAAGATFYYSIFPARNVPSSPIAVPM